LPHSLSSSDAPALTQENDPTVTTVEKVVITENEDNEDWEDGASSSRLAAVAATETIRNMTSTTAQPGLPDDIAEKLRVKETKAQLAAARKGMELEAQKRKQAEAEKKKEAETKVASRFSGAAAGGGGKWVGSRMRTAQGSSASRFGLASRMKASQKVDTQSQELFPDLAVAEKILEKKEKDKPKQATKKAPPGSATWGSKKKAPAPPKEPEPPKQEEAKPVEPPKPAPAKPAAAKPAAPKVAKKVTKKKKKDLSTFKPSS